MKRMSLFWLGYILMGFLISMTFAASQVISAVPTNARVGDSIVYRITTKIPDGNLTYAYARYEIRSYMDYGTNAIISGVYWQADGDAYENSSQVLNQTAYSRGAIQLAWLVNEPIEDLYKGLNWIWIKDHKVSEYINQIENYLGQLDMSVYYDTYGTVIMKAELTENGYGFTTKMVNETGGVLSYVTKIYSNTGFLFTYEYSTSETTFVRYEILPSESNAFVEEQNYALIFGLTYGLVFGGGAFLGAAIAHLRVKRRPKLAADV